MPTTQRRQAYLRNYNNQVTLVSVLRFIMHNDNKLSSLIFHLPDTPYTRIFVTSTYKRYVNSASGHHDLFSNSHWISAFKRTHSMQNLISSRICQHNLTLLITGDDKSETYVPVTCIHTQTTEALHHAILCFLLLLLPLGVPILVQYQYPVLIFCRPCISVHLS